MTYPQTLEYLDSFLNYEQMVAYRYPDAFRLDRMERFLDRLGNPHRRYPTLHVAGTKGKGSTCAFAASILRATGYRVGLYTSPHLISFRERIQLSGQPISEEDLADIASMIQPQVTQELTYFEVTTALAFLHFARAGVDVAVIEVGLGGRLDATNVLTPEVTAITPISRDHIEKLGDTVEEIAQEKAGIIKPNIPLVLAPQLPSVERLIREVAVQQQAPIHGVVQEVLLEIHSCGREGTRCSIRTPCSSYPHLGIPLLGRHQVTNAATGIRLAELWLRLEEAAPGPEGHWVESRGGLRMESVQEGLTSVQWPGRCQLIEGTPSILLDGAHNADSVAALRATVEELFPGRRIVLIFGTSLEKDLAGMAAHLGPWGSALVLTRAQVPRAESPERVAQAFRPWHPDPILAPSVDEALERARAIAAAGDLIVVAGSLFLVGEALEVLGYTPATLKYGQRASETVASGTGSRR